MKHNSYAPRFATFRFALDKPGFTVALAIALLGAAAVTGMFFFPNLFTSNGAEHRRTIQPTPPRPYQLVPLDELTINVDEPRLLRCLRLKFLVLLREEDKVTVQKLIREKRSTLLTRLTRLFDAQKMTSIRRNDTGESQTLQEIKELLNSVIAPDGKELVLDVRFDEFEIQ